MINNIIECNFRGFKISGLLQIKIVKLCYCGGANLPLKSIRDNCPEKNRKSHSFCKKKKNENKLLIGK